MHSSPTEGGGKFWADGPFKSRLGWRPTYAGVRPVDNRRGPESPAAKASQTLRGATTGSCSTLRWAWPMPVSKGRNMRSTSSGFMKPCNSPCFAQLAAFFIDLRAE